MQRPHHVCDRSGLVVGGDDCEKSARLNAINALYYRRGSWPVVLARRRCVAHDSLAALRRTPAGRSLAQLEPEEAS